MLKRTEEGNIRLLANESVCEQQGYKFCIAKLLSLREEVSNCDDPPNFTTY